MNAREPMRRACVGRVLCGAAIAAGCGRLGFQSQLPPGDGSALDGPGDGRASYRDAVLADAPLGYWRLGDTGSTLHDEIGRHDGNSTGACATGTTGALAGDGDAALGFDGASCAVTLGSAFGFPDNTPFSVEAWVSPRTFMATQHIFTKQHRLGGPVDGYALLLYGGAARWERVVNQVNTRPGDVSVAISTYTHLVGVYDGAAMVLHVDGIAGTPAADTDPMNAIADTAYIGASPEGNFFDGAIDEVAVYDHALPADRIRVHHNLGAPVH
ncbi:MAG: LamG domain-containing protein [Deltaproteobacteria bacterium]|nr:MAG: LamG domain-containing protein [Deltaproteobacteria bacterium]TMQ24262.1 MAG: LamG domain-containing protein [Deltaproteobacteria bacterium]